MRSSGGSLVPGFHSLEVLHRGASSTVYRAVPDGGGDPVAVRVLRGPDGVAASARLRRLSDVPGVARVLGDGTTTSGRPFVVLEHHAGGDYGRILRERHPLPVDEVVRVGLDLARALAGVHALGLLHHAVEPSKVLAGEEGVLLADGGGALAPGVLPPPIGPRTDALLHAPPEVLSGEPPTAASDVYRLAATLWELLAGRPPFGGAGDASADPFAYRERVLGGAAPGPARPDVPAALTAALTRALDRDPARRFQDAEGLAAALAASGGGAGESVAAPEDGDAPDTSGTDHRGAESHDATHAHGTTGRKAPGPGADAFAVDPAPAPPSADPPPGGPAVSPESGQEAVGTPPTVTGPMTGPATAHPAAPETPSASTAPAADEDPWRGLVEWDAARADPAPPPPAPGFGADTPYAAPAAPRRPGPADPGPRAPAPYRSAPRTGTGGGHTPAPEPRRDLREAGEPRSRRLLLVQAAVSAVAVVVIVLGLLAFVYPGRVAALLASVGLMETAPGPADAGPASADPSSAPHAAVSRESAPTEVAVEDSGDSVVLTWTDNAGEGTPHHVVGGPAGATSTALAEAEPGAARARVSGLDAAGEYCFVVIAVLGADEVAPSEEACTERGAG